MNYNNLSVVAGRPFVRTRSLMITQLHSNHVITNRKNGMGVSEKGGILKKPGAPPYGPPMDAMSTLERDKWIEDNADRLSRLDR